MLQIRRSEERGRASHGWLRSAHSFSFGDYFDPEHAGFDPLLIINEDGQPLAAGDALKLIEERAVILEQADAAAILLFDLPS